MKITDDMLTEWRKQFEVEFPMPPDCVWTGKGYVATSYNAWETHTFIARWEGWQAARRTTPDREAIITGHALVPVEPTEKMVVAGFESWPDEFFSCPDEWKEFEKMTGCQQAAHKARLCYAAMIAAAPEQTPIHSPRDTLIEEIAEMVDHMGEGRRLEEYVGAIREMKGGNR
ncbi:TPA: hypothetical protein QDA82_003760 [Burkholderia vietnamiensis]|nr:hypothetical protein [Burkholderia vietnamiensis]